MTTLQTLELRQSEVRERLGEIAGLEGDALTDAIRSEADALQREHKDLELRRRAAIVAGDGGAPDAADPADSNDGEAAEFRALRERVEVRRYVGAALDGAAVNGAEAEFNAALDMGAGSFPLRLLAPEREARATTDVDASASQRPWLDRLMADTAAAHVGVTSPSVPAGVQAYPVTTAGPTPAQRGRGEAADDGSFTIGVTEARPTRASVRVIISTEDAARLPGLEDALRRDLAAALTERIDRAIFLSDSGANENRADIAGFNTASITEVTLTQAHKVLAGSGDGSTSMRFLNMVDGIHATRLEDLRVVASVGANTLWRSHIHTATASTETIAGFLTAAGLTWRVRGDIATATGNGDFGAFVRLGRGISGAAVAPVWEAGRLIRDPFSEAASGEVALTLQSLWAFVIPRPQNWRRLKFVT